MQHTIVAVIGEMLPESRPARRQAGADSHERGERLQPECSRETRVVG